MTREEYREVYLRSDHWLETRAAALERADNRCQVCNGTKQLDVHHRTYERVGNERDMDLTVLCRRCHNLFHDSRGKPSKGKKRTKKTHRLSAAPVHRVVSDAQKAAEEDRVTKLRAERKAQKQRQAEHKQELAKRRSDWREERALPRRAA